MFGLVIYLLFFFFTLIRVSAQRLKLKGNHTVQSAMWCSDIKENTACHCLSAGLFNFVVDIERVQIIVDVRWLYYLL
jgi:hypothetical protein